jgi:cytochrome P450
MNQYLDAEIDQKFKEYAESVSSPATKSHIQSKSIISLALEQYFSDVGNKGQNSEEFKETARSQLRMFLFSGHDTTSSTLLYCYYLLSTHPDILSKVRQEHDTIFGSDFSIENIRHIITKDPHLLNQIPYTSAAIKEVLRIFPPGASMREGHRDFTVVDEEGNRFPTEGCNVWTLNLVMHHSPEVFVRPEEFLPQRWLVGAEDPLYPVKGSWRAFEWGQRNCIGQTLATLELRIALVMTLRMFEIAPAYDEWDRLHPRKGITMVEGQRIYQAEMGGGGAHPVDGVPVRATLRK